MKFWFWKLQLKYYHKEVTLAVILLLAILIFFGIAYTIKHEADFRLQITEREKDLQTVLCLLNGTLAVNDAAMWRSERNIKLNGE